MTRIHAALCRICGEGIRKAGEQVAPAGYPFYLSGFVSVDVAHRKCANARYHEASGGAATLAAAERKGVSE